MSLVTKTLDASLVTFSEATKNRNGNTSVFVNYGSRRSLVIQTAKLRAPFGVSEYSAGGTATKYSVDVSLDDEDSLKIFKTLDSLALDAASRNSVAWFGKSMTREMVESMYRPLVRLSKSPEKYAPTTKFKLKTGFDDKVQAEVYDQNRQPFDIKKLGSGSHVKTVIELGPVWFMNKQFGLTFNAVQVEVYPVEKLVGFAFED